MASSDEVKEKLDEVQKTLDEKFQEKLDEVKNNPAIIARGAISLVVGWSVSAIAGIAIHTLVPKDTLSRKQKAQLMVGAWAMGGAVGKSASSWAANDSMTSTILGVVANTFKKTEVKTEASVDEEPKTEEAPTE